MKKTLKWLLAALIVYVIGDFGLGAWLDKRIAENPAYTESDMLIYKYFTDSDIAETPKISSDYHFEYHIGDGYAPTSEIVFQHAGDLVQLRDYLKRLGYEKAAKPDGDAEVWRKPTKPDATFYLWHNKESNEIKLSKIFDPMP